MAPGSPAQLLAHPGRNGSRGAGSALAAEPWWPRAVFYRLDVARFQASAENSVGDLAGVTQRLDYLQSLGLDALVLDTSAPLPLSSLAAPSLTAAPVDPYAGSFALEDLIREASRRHLRVLLAVTPGLAQASRSALLQTVHDWLAAGAAGVVLPRAPQVSDSAYNELAAALASLLRLSPGDRVLLTEPASGSSSLPVVAEIANQRRPSGRASAAGREAHQLALAQPLPVRAQPGGDLAAGLRMALSVVANRPSSAAAAVLRFAALPRTGSPDAAALATTLLASPGPALFDFGAEIGLNTGPASPSDSQSSTPPPVMQWTPANVFIAPIERTAPPPPPAPGQPTPFGAYRPFVRPPPRSLTGNAPTAPAVAVDRNLPPAPPDPNTLPGFTSGTLPVPPVDAATVNVATEERSPGSVLNAYRALLALHHGNVALRDGPQVFLNHDAQNVLVFVRRAPAGARTAGSVVVAANFSDTPVVLSLDAELAALGLHPGALRALFSFGPQLLTGELTGALRLPPHAVYLGELRRDGR